MAASVKTGKQSVLFVEPPATPSTPSSYKLSSHPCIPADINRPTAFPFPPPSPNSLPWRPSTNTRPPSPNKRHVTPAASSTSSMQFRKTPGAKLAQSACSSGNGGLAPCRNPMPISTTCTSTGFWDAAGQNCLFNSKSVSSMVE